MPLKPCQIKGKRGWKWGDSGKCYPGSRGRSKALKQARAIEASKNRTQNVSFVTNPPPNSLKIDPTRTITLRRAAAALARRRYKLLSLKIKTLNDLDGGYFISPPITNEVAYRVDTIAGKIVAFESWLRGEITATVLTNSDEALWSSYTTQAFGKGMRRAYDDSRRLYFAAALANGTEALAFYQGGRSEFLRNLFSLPATAETLNLLTTRLLADLRSVTEAVVAATTRTLADCLTRNFPPGTTVTALLDRVDKIGRVRSEIVTHTELVRAFAEGQLLAFEHLNVTEITLLAERKIADGGRCGLCAGFLGKILSPAEARGLVPFHPYCRCAWIPKR
jgi:hypothetical protein